VKKRILVHALLVVVALALTATIVFAALELVGTDTRTNGETIVTWDSRFADIGYTLGDTITMTVTWTVDEGVAEYVDFGLRCPDNNGSNSPGKGSGRGCINFTPRSKRDSVSGELDEEATEMIDDSDDDNGDGIFEGAVKVQFKFTDLHLAPLRDVEMGNAHFKLYLEVDTDGDDKPDKVVSYGVNVLVEEPQ